MLDTGASIRGLARAALETCLAEYERVVKQSLTRERVVLMLTDVDRAGAEHIVRRLLDEFRERFATLQDLPIELGYFEVSPGTGPLTVKQVLPTVFGVEPDGEPGGDA